MWSCRSGDCGRAGSARSRVPRPPASPAPAAPPRHDRHRLARAKPSFATRPRAGQPWISSSFVGVSIEVNRFANQFTSMLSAWKNRHVRASGALQRPAEPHRGGRQNRCEQSPKGERAGLRPGAGAVSQAINNGHEMTTAFSGLDLSLGNLYRLSDAKSRSISPENFTGEPGKGGMATEGTGASCARDLGQGWKISPSIEIAPPLPVPWFGSVLLQQAEAGGADGHGVGPGDEVVAVAPAGAGHVGVEGRGRLRCQLAELQGLAGRRLLGVGRVVGEHAHPGHDDHQQRSRPGQHAGAGGRLPPGSVGPSPVSPVAPFAPRRVSRRRRSTPWRPAPGR